MGAAPDDGHEPAVYAHVATDPAFPGKLALQYWFFYPFNDFNNTHEGDWEMIQLVFDASDAAAAIAEEHPADIGYSSHEGAERADWGEGKLEIVDRTHPVVYPAAGSHANKFTAALYLGSSADAGVGCDDTQGPHREIRPVVLTIPSDPAAAADAFPWITFEGRWGELQKAFFNGPTGPNLKEQWTSPIEWANGWRDRSYAVPAGGSWDRRHRPLLLRRRARLRDPGQAAAEPRRDRARARSAPRPDRLRDRPGDVDARRPAARRAAAHVGPDPLRVRADVPEASAPVHRAGASPDPDRHRHHCGAMDPGVGHRRDLERDGRPRRSAGVRRGGCGTTLTLLGFGLVQAATACALVELDAGRSVRALGAYRLALRRIRPLLGSIAIFVAVLVVLTTSVFLIPVALWVAVRWSLVAPVVELEDRPAYEALRRSGELVRGRWLRVGSLVGLGGLIALAAGPLIGALLIFVSSSSLALLNLVAGIVYAVALPFVAIVTAYVYFDARTRLELEPRDVRAELPAEISVEPA